MAKARYDKVSIIIPRNPFSPTILQAQQCLCALDVAKIMEWWPGFPHTPHRDANKVRAIQRSLDWKRVASIAAYLLQAEIVDAPSKIEKYFQKVYEPRRLEPGREWPPKISQTISFEPSGYPVFPNILIHLNGAQFVPSKRGQGAGQLVINPKDDKLRFSVIDGQHRINGAYLALKIRQEKDKHLSLELPSTVFLDLDPADQPPRNQAQIFIDVNFYQKKVDRSLVVDLFPTARGRGAVDDRERAQDIGRQLMLETGPLVGMIQIPGIKYGVKNVVTLATLVGAVEDVLDALRQARINDLAGQTAFTANALSAWLKAAGRYQDPAKIRTEELDPDNVIYQGRILVSVINLIPAMLAHLASRDEAPLLEETELKLADWSRHLIERADLLKNGKFIDRKQFRVNGYLGSVGIGRFRDLLWAAVSQQFSKNKLTEDDIHKLAEKARAKANIALFKRAR
jgi:DGQHR domain-containing protein